MKTESVVRIIAGSIVLLGTSLAWLVSPWWLVLPAFVSVSLIQSAFTGFCPPTIIMTKLGWVDRDGVVHPGRGKGA